MIALQEVTPVFLQLLAGQPWVRDLYHLQAAPVQETENNNSNDSFNSLSGSNSDDGNHHGHVDDGMATITPHALET